GKSNFLAVSESRLKMVFSSAGNEGVFGDMVERTERKVKHMSWYDDKPVYYDKKPGLVKLPHDPLLEDPDKLAKLSGEVVVYKIEELYSQVARSHFFTSGNNYTIIVPNR